MVKITVGKNFEIKLPKDLMNKMNLKPGDDVYFQLEGLEEPGDTLVLKKA